MSNPATSFTKEQAIEQARKDLQDEIDRKIFESINFVMSEEQKLECLKKSRKPINSILELEL